MLTGDFSPPPAVLAQVVKRQKDQLALVPAGSARYVSMNTTVKPFDDINVRKRGGRRLQPRGDAPGARRRAASATSRPT